MREQIAQQAIPPTPRLPRPTSRDSSRRVDQPDVGRQGNAPARQAQDGLQEAVVDELEETATISRPHSPVAQENMLTRQNSQPAQWALKPESQAGAERPLPGVNIEEQEETAPAPLLPAGPGPVKEKKTEAQKEIVEEMPTMPLAAEGAAQTRSVEPPPVLGAQTPYFNEVMQLDTVPLSTRQQLQPMPERPPLPPQPGDQAARQWLAGAGNFTPAMQRVQMPGWGQMPGTKRRKSRASLLFTLGLLCLLLAGGLVAWLYVFQPFTIAPVTQPQQTFQNADLGVSLAYPTGWTVQLDQKNAAAHFSDSSHTAQFSIIAVAANGQEAGQYLQQEAKQLDMTGLHPITPPLPAFANTSWQQIQGSVQQEGANYTQVLLVAVHGNRLFSVIQQAPQTTYADEEQVIFSPMRSSLRFLS